MKIQDHISQTHGKWSLVSWVGFLIFMCVPLVMSNDVWNCGNPFRYPLILITVFNVWDLISRYIPLLECLKLESRKGLLIASLLRFLLIPAFYFSAKNGEEGWMIVLTSFLGLTNGYLSVCILTVAPRGYKVSLYNQDMQPKLSLSIGFMTHKSYMVYAFTGSWTKCIR